MPDEPRPDSEPQAAVDPIAAAALLGEPIRRALYEHVVAAESPVDRDEAAAAIGIGRPLAAFHLDRLAVGGLLEVEYRRRSGRSGPGAGRPAKFYRRRRGLTLELTLPARRYRLAAEILADGVDQRGDAAATPPILAAARRRGAALAAGLDSGRTADGSAGRRSKRAGRERLLTVLSREGFEPVDDGESIRLRNCPFDALTAEHRGVTCSMNLALLEGVVDGVGEAGLRAEPRPVEGACCVRFVPA